MMIIHHRLDDKGDKLMMMPHNQITQISQGIYYCDLLLHLYAMQLLETFETLVKQKKRKLKLSSISHFFQSFRR